ncbi:MAG: acyltransferase [Limisphaerales bacterium]
MDETRTGGEPLEKAAIGPLRDFPNPEAGPAPTTPAVSEYNNAKIRNLCLLLSIAVVFNHAVTWGDLRLWQGESIAMPDLADGAVGRFELLSQFFVSGALGRITNPVFFLASGYLFFWAWRPSWSSLCRKWKRRTLSLLAPWAIWAALGKLLWLADYLVTNRHALGVMIRKGTWGGEELLMTYLGMHVPSQLWFLQQLMYLMVFVVPVLIWLLPRLGWWVLGLGAILFFIPGLDPILIFRKPGLCFFTVGALLGYKAQDLALPSRRHAWILTGAWLVGAAAYTAAAVFGSMPLTAIYKALVLLGVVGIWGAYDVFPETFRRGLGHLAPYRFFVYMGFDPLLPILHKHGYGAFAGSEMGRVAAYVVFPLAVVFLCTAGARLLLAISPGVYDVVSGGRTPGLVPQPRA